MIRKIVGGELSAPAVMKDELCAAAEKSGLIEPESWKSQEAWENTWRAMCQVWASKWTDRAWLSRRTMGLKEEAIFVGCLLQKVVPAEYAFVIHTVHPISKDGFFRNVLRAQVVAGLGDVLVGNYPGNAFSFTIPKDGKAMWGSYLGTEPKITSLPSRCVAYFASNDCLIARSDSNGEDLENYAGAGLYDSVMARSPTKMMVDYSEERLLWDVHFRLISDIKKVGVSVEAAFEGQPQDIEGVYRSGEITVVQARPQIL